VSNIQSPLIAAALALLCAIRPSGAEERPTTAPHHTLEIESLRITLDPGGQVRAEGAVRITAYDLELSAGFAVVDTTTGQIVLGPPLRVELDGAIVSGTYLHLSHQARRLEIDQPLISLPLAPDRELELSAMWARCEGGSCELEHAEGTTCPHQPPAYRLRAEHVTIHPSGDVDLSRASLLIDDLEVLEIPWLRVRPPTSAGFLPPRVAWDARGGLILGPAGQVPLSDDLVLSGHAAVRTSQGFETSSSARTPAGHATVAQLFDAPQNHVRARFHLTPPLRGATLTVDGDVVDGRRIIDDLEFDPLERARTHTATTALLSTRGADWFLAESRLELVQAFDPAGRLDRHLHTPTIGVAAELLPVVQAGPVWPALTLELIRRETGVDSRAPDAATGIAPEHTRVAVSPSLAHAGRFGPLAGELRIGSLHQLWLPDRAGGSRDVRQLASASAELDLPLIGHPGGLRHVIAPLVRYRITPWIDGEGPIWVMDDLDRLERGHGVEAGFETSLGTDGRRDAIELAAFERADLPGFEAPSGLAYLHVTAAAGPPWLRLETSGSWDHREHLPSSATLMLTTADDRGNRLETGGGWYGPGRGAHLDRGFGTTDPWLSGRWVGETDRALGLVERATVAFTRRLRASAGALIGLIPDARLQALWYGLELGSPCGCLTAGILASHRLGSWVPDVMATVSLGQL
jgi:hypothetical protein